MLCTFLKYMTVFYININKIFLIVSVLNFLTANSPVGCDLSLQKGIKLLPWAPPKPTKDKDSLFCLHGRHWKVKQPAQARHARDGQEENGQVLCCSTAFQIHGRGAEGMRKERHLKKNHVCISPKSRRPSQANTGAIHYSEANQARKRWHGRTYCSCVRWAAGGQWRWGLQASFGLHVLQTLSVTHAHIQNVLDLNFLIKAWSKDLITVLTPGFKLRSVLTLEPERCWWCNGMAFCLN